MTRLQNRTVDKLAHARHMAKLFMNPNVGQCVSPATRLAWGRSDGAGETHCPTLSPPRFRGSRREMFRRILTPARVEGSGGCWRRTLNPEPCYRHRSLLLSALLLFTVSFSCFAQELEQTRIVELKGTAEVSADGGLNWIATQTNQVL